MKSRWIIGCVAMLCAASLALAEGREPDALRASMQILVVTTQDWNGVEGTVQVYERPTDRKKWKAAGDPIPVVVGKKRSWMGRGSGGGCRIARRGRSGEAGRRRQITGRDFPAEHGLWIRRTGEGCVENALPESHPIGGMCG